MLIELLQAVPAEAWAGLSGVIIGALMSILGTWLSSRASLNQLKAQLQFDKEQATRELNRNRLEELYTGINEWSNNIANNYLTLMMVMDEKLTYNQYLDKIIEYDKSRKYDFGRLEMIIKVYGTDFISLYENAISARSILNEIAIAFRQSYLSGNPEGSKFVNNYIAAQKTFEAKNKALLDKIAECAKKKNT